MSYTQTSGSPGKLLFKRRASRAVKTYMKTDFMVMFNGRDAEDEPSTAAVTQGVIIITHKGL